jgi:hypothetical protein
MSSNMALPPGSARIGFEAAARAHEEARARQQAGTPPAAASSPARQTAPVRPRAAVEQAIASAAQRTSVDFNFLIAQAQVESAMNPSARARTSSATGLFQFIDSTWLATLQKHGDRFGLGGVAGEIGTNRSGQAFIADPARREAILGLRNNPEIASLMAAALAEDNRAHLQPILGRAPDHAELYLAHFLGAGGAGRFLSAMQANPQQSAASLFGKAAAANRTIFYEANGAPRSLAGVMDLLGNKMQRALDMVPGSEAARFASLDPGANPMPFGDWPDPAMIAAGSYQAGSQALTNRPGSAGFTSAPLPAAKAGRVPMSQIIDATFGAGESAGGSRASAQIRRAYDQFRAFGL